MDAEEVFFEAIVGTLSLSRRRCEGGGFEKKGRHGRSEADTRTN